MTHEAGKILKTYLALTLLSTLASSFIWGVNTLFLLDAGLTITEAFAANAFFTVGQVIFEVPTGVVADTVGRRASYLLGSITLFLSTGLYLYLWQVQGPFWLWAVSSILLGLGFTFFSGATEAWLVDGLKHTGYTGTLDAIFAKGQIAGGIAMLVGTVGGGVVAQFTNLGVPYILRIVLLGLTFLVAYVAMRDIGFAPRKRVSVSSEVKFILKNSLKHGLGNPPVRWLMLAGPFTAGVGIYGFYAMQPYLLQLYGNTSSYTIAGLAAAIVASTQIAGGFAAPYLRKLFKLRTTALFYGVGLSAIALIGIGVIPHFWIALLLLSIWGGVFAASMPIRQAYLNTLIPSAQRATVLSSDNLLASSGGVVIQPGLGKAADIYSYGTSYIIAGCIELLALPFIALARKQRAKGDTVEKL
jgi:MFS family permease